MKKIALASLLAALSFQASASLVTTRADWTAATAVAKTLAFEGVAPSGGYTYRDQQYSVGGVSFSNGSLYSISSSFSGGDYTAGTGDALFNNQEVSTVSIDLGGDYSAFSIDLRGYAGSADTFTVTLSDNQVFSVTSGATAAFFGVTLDHTITGLTITNTYYAVYDNLSVGAAGAAVPEPASIALLGLGLFGLAFARRKSVK